MSFAVDKAFFDLGKSFKPGLILKTAKAIDTMNSANKNWNSLLAAGLKSNQKYVRTLSKVFKIYSTSSDMISSLGEGTLNAMGLMLQLADAMGILQPITQFLSALFSMMGAAAFEVLMPAMQKLFDLLKDESFVAFLMNFGMLIGKFFGFVIEMFVKLFDDPNVQKAILTFMKLFVKLIEIIIGIVSWFVTTIAALPIGALLAVFVIIATIAAFWWGFSHGGPIVGAIMAAITGITLGILAASLAMGAMAEGGIVTRPTIALIGEKGPEAVIPLSEGMGSGNNEELIWAMEDNNTRLDIIIQQNERLYRTKKRKRR